MGRLMIVLTAWILISIPTGLVTGRILRLRATSALLALDLGRSPRAVASTYTRIHQAPRSRVRGPSSR